MADSSRPVKLIASFLLSYPLAGLLKRVPDGQPWKKNAFIIAVSLFYIIGLFDLWDGLRTLLYSAAGTYAIAYYVDGSLMPWIGFVFLMGHMSIGHIRRQAVDDPQVIDITGAQMVLVMKLSSFCWNVHDGRLPQEQLSEAQRYSAVTKFPSILDYLGYVLFFPSLFAGPSFDFVDYRRWIDTTLFDIPPGTDPSKAPPTRKKRRIPRSGRPATKKGATGIFWILAFLVFGGRYNQGTVLGEQFRSYYLPRRVWLLYVLGVATRMKYYGVWALTEGACILSGMGYNGFDERTGKVFWNRLENVNPMGVETAQNSHAYLGSWNKNTNHWLRNYIYLRVTPKGKKPGFRASLVTFATSAFWHGFYPGYYLTFVLAAFIQTAGKSMPQISLAEVCLHADKVPVDFRRYIRPFFLSQDGSKPTQYKRYYDILSWVITQLTLSFAVAPFIILSFRDSLAVWCSVYFYGAIGTLASVALFASPAQAFFVRQLKLRNKPYPGKSVTQEPTRPPTLGLPSDPTREFDEALQEVMEEIESRRRRGSVVAMPSKEELKAAVESRTGASRR